MSSASWATPARSCTCQSQMLPSRISPISSLWTTRAGTSLTDDTARILLFFVPGGINLCQGSLTELIGVLPEVRLNITIISRSQTPRIACCLSHHVASVLYSVHLLLASSRAAGTCHLPTHALPLSFFDSLLQLCCLHCQRATIQAGSRAVLGTSPELKAEQP